MNFQMSDKVLAVIPVRFASTRFPGKPLAKIGGKTLLAHTYSNAANIPGIDYLLVATDDERIASHCKEIGADFVMTSGTHTTGTDRVLEAVQKWSQSHGEPAIVINIQGDEPCLPPSVISGMLNLLATSPEAPIATAASKVPYSSSLEKTSVVKCVVDEQQNALYFSRSVIPRGHTSPETLLCHIGVYAFRYPFLAKYGSLPKTPLQLAEDLEQLKVIEHGFKIKTAIVDEPSLGVDTPEDLEKVKKYLCRRNLSSSQAELSLP